MQSSREFLTAREVATALGVTPGRVYQLVASHDLPSLRRGRSVRIPRAAWEEWLAMQSRAALASLQSPNASREEDAQ